MLRGISLREALENYNHVELSEEETMEAILWGKQKKQAEIKAAEVRQREQENRKHLTQTQWSYDQTRSFMLYRAAQIFEGKFALDSYNQPIFDLLCYYFSADPKFVSMAEGMGIENTSLDKGILLFGNFGVGKTWLMKLFMKNQRQVFHVHNAKKIADFYEKDGDEAIEPFLSKTKNPINDAAAFYHPYTGLCLDDIGTEDRKVNYGNKRNVIGDIIELRYEKQNTGIWLHGTTNLTVGQIESYYGGRVRSRLREVCNLLELNGGDRRK